jgi:hypothetical protein
MNSFKIKYTILSLLIFVALLVSSCQKANRLDCIKRTGSITTENRVLGSFSIIEVYDNVQVFLIQDTSNFVLIKAGENLLSNITTNIEGQTLVIKNKNKCNFTRSYKYQIEIYIHFKKLDELIYRGTGPITSLNTLVNDTFTFNSWDGTDSVKLNIRSYLWSMPIYIQVWPIYSLKVLHISCMLMPEIVAHLECKNLFVKMCIQTIRVQAIVTLMLKINLKLWCNTLVIPITLEIQIK